MSRTIRIVLAVVALALTVSGAFVSRYGAAQSLTTTLKGFAEQKHDPPPAELVKAIEPAVERDMIGESLIGLGLVFWIVIGAQFGRTSVAFTVAAALVAMAASAFSVTSPTSRLPEMAVLQPPSGEWPYGIISLDKAWWNVFIVRTKQNEWAVTVERGSPVGPDGLKVALERRFEKAKRPVRVYLDMSCPDDTQKVFLDAARSVAGPAGVKVDDQPLPDRANFEPLRRARREEQLAPYVDTVRLGSLAHLLSAAALALVVWWTPKNPTGGSIVATGNLILAFGQAIALPVALYVAMTPPEPGYPDYKQLATHVHAHLWLAAGSAVALVLGAVVATIGAVATPTLTPPEPLKLRAAAGPPPQPPPAAPPEPTSPSS